MSVEQYYTRFSTTVAIGGYTAGAGALNVAATAGTAPVFRVIIVDQATGAYKALLKVTAVNSGTQYATSTDPGGTDANCVAGDLVYALLTADAMDSMRANLHQIGAIASLPSSPKAGDEYSPTDGVNRSVYDGSAWNFFGPTYAVKPPSDSGFSWYNTQTWTTYVAEANSRITLKSTGDGGSNIVGRKKNKIGSTFTAETGYNIVGDSISTNIEGGMFLTDGTKVITLGVQSINSPWRPRFSIYSSATGFAGDVYYPNNYFGNPYFVRVVEDATHRTYYMGTSPTTWTQVFQEAINTFLTTSAYGWYIRAATPSKTTLEIFHFNEF